MCTDLGVLTVSKIDINKDLIHSFWLYILAKLKQ